MVSKQENPKLHRIHFIIATLCLIALSELELLTHAPMFAAIIGLMGIYVWVNEVRNG